MSDNNPSPTTKSSPNLARSIDKLISSNKKLLLVIIPIGIILIAIVIGGFFWYKTNFLDGQKTDISQNFTSINYNIPYQVSIIKSNKNRIEISNNNNTYDDKIDFVVSASELKLTNKSKVSVSRTGAPTVVIYAKDLSKIINNDKGNIQIDKITANEIDIESKDKGNINVENIESQKLIVSVKDSGDITVKSGKTITVEATIVNSSGRINLEGVEAKSAKTKDVGTGTIKLSPNTIDETKEKSKKK